MALKTVPYLLVFLCFICWCSDITVLNAKRLKTRDTSEPESTGSDADDETDDDDELGEEYTEEEDTGNYIYVLYTTSIGGPMNFSGILINDEIVATMKITNIDENVQLCQNDTCEPTVLDKEAEDAMYWKLQEKRSGPIVYSDDFYNASCKSDTYEVFVTKTEEESDDDDSDSIYIECSPACKNGDAIVCNSKALGLVTGDDEPWVLTTIAQLLKNGGYVERVHFEPVRKSRPQEVVKQPPQEGGDKEKLRAQNSTAIVSRISVPPTIVAVALYVSSGNV